MRQISLTDSGLFATVDDEDYQRVVDLPKTVGGGNRHWTALKGKYTNYAILRYFEDGKAKLIWLHRFIMGVEYVPHTECEVDHVNHDGLLCTKKNLRIGSRAQNIRNKSSAKNSSSKYLGVSYMNNVRGYKKWRVLIYVNEEDIHIGNYYSEYSAALAYNEAALKYFGEWANLNILPDDYLELIQKDEYEVQQHKKQKETTRRFSKYRGVTLDKKSKVKLWKVNLTHNGKLAFVGSSYSECEAALMYNIKNKELYGESAFQNQLPDDYEKLIDSDIHESKLQLVKVREERNNSKTKKSQYIGVIPYPSKTGSSVIRYQARITINGKVVHLGTYPDEISAAKAHDAKSREVFGNYGYINIKEEN